MTAFISFSIQKRHDNNIGYSTKTPKLLLKANELLTEIPRAYQYFLQKLKFTFLRIYMLPDDKASKHLPLYTRTAITLAQRYAAIYPVITINGPRQSGKTTPAQYVFPHLPYVSFEDFAIQNQFQSDPYKFLELYRAGAVFDEVQHAPQLLSYLQQVIDSSNV